MSRKAKEEAEKTRIRILASALSLFAKRGYAHTTFTNIADRLQMTKGAVYWHFASKEALLMALVDEMMEKFSRQIERLMPHDALTFEAVAKMLVTNADEIVNDPKSRAFFLLMHEQIQWSSDSMAQVREQILKNTQFGPWNALNQAVLNDIQSGRVRAGVNAERVAHVCLAMFDGLLHAYIAKFMTCDLKETMELAFEGVWQDIRA